jgi:hypothetical protein
VRNSHEIFYAGDSLDRPLALLADFDIDIEYAPQALSPGYCHGWHVCRFCRSKSRLLPWMACMPVLQEQKPVIAMDGMYAGFAGAFFCGAKMPWKRVRLTLGFGTRAESSLSIET